MPDIADLMADCDALASSDADSGRRQQHAAHLRQGLTHMAEEIRDLRAQRESLESQVMEMANEMTAVQRAWENVVHMSAYYDDDDDDPDFDPAV